MSKFRFDAKAQTAKTQKGVLLLRMANEAVNYFKVDVFDSKSFDGVGWKPNIKQDGRQQLVKTGRMRESIRVLSKTNNTIIVGSDVPYANFHNEGSGRMPKRQFIGEAKKLKLKFEIYISDYLKRVGKRARI